MKTRTFGKKILGFALLLVLVAGVGSMPANAQTKKGGRKPNTIIVYRSYYPYWYTYDPFWSPYYYPRYYTMDPIAYQREKGYREGRDEGKEDAKKGRPANAEGHEDYLKSESLAFREAFVQGYNESYPEKVADIKKDMLEEGRDKGKEDAKKNRPADPTRHKEYLKATAPEYREAFVQGYNERYQQQVSQMRDRADN